MKKILAVILSIAMLFSVLAINTFAEATPTVTLITNEGSPVVSGASTYITVRFDNFDSIKGMDVIITAEGATLGTVTPKGDFPALTLGENYTVTNTETTHQIRIVDLASFNTGRIVFSVTAPSATAPITVTGKYAKSGTELFSITTEAGNLEVKTEEVEVPPSIEEKLEEEYVTENETVEGEETTYTIDNTKAEASNVFYPQGSVYKEIVNDDGTTTYSYADKDADGNFTITSDYKAQAYEIPENGITTFGVSENTADSKSIRFGNYSQYETAPDFHGTMVFEGNWLALKNYYIQKGYSVQEFIEKIYENFDTTLEGKTGKTFVTYTLGDEKINVYKFKQKKHMWQGANGNKDVLEYALRLTGVKDGKTYTAVAYSELDGVPTISANVKSETRPITTAE